MLTSTHPSLPSEEKRETRIYVRVTPTEHRLLLDSLAGRTVSAVLREALSAYITRQRTILKKEALD